MIDLYKSNGRKGRLDGVQARYIPVGSTPSTDEISYLFYINSLTVALSVHDSRPAATYFVLFWCLFDFPTARCIFCSQLLFFFALASFQLLPLARAPLQLVANSFVFRCTAGSLFVLPESSSLFSFFLCFLICFSFSFAIVVVASNHASRTAVAKCAELYVAWTDGERALS